MNKVVDIPQGRPFFPMPRAPRRYTAADIFFFLDAGLLADGVKFELLDGAIRPMSPKGNEHEAMRLKIARWMRGAWADNFDSLQEHTLTTGDETLLEPDFVVFTIGIDLKARKLTSADILLIVEVADSSLDYDLVDKAEKYAAFGVGEYWVVNARTGVTRVHRAPAEQGWTEQRDVPAGEPLAPLCAPTAMLKL